MGCDIYLLIQNKINGKWINVDFPDKDIDNRNYNLFAVLANVRNGTWSDKIPYISDPKGLPSDLEIPQDDDYPLEPKYLGDHSYSHLTVQELLNYNWDGPINMRVYVDKEFAENWDDKTHPGSFAAWSSTGVEIRYASIIKDEIHNWYNKYIPWLQSLGDPNNIRLVFGFDS